MSPAKKSSPKRFCFYCGEPASFRDDVTSLWVCGDSAECDRELSNAHEEMRQDAHDAVDREFGLY